MSRAAARPLRGRCGAGVDAPGAEAPHLVALVRERLRALRARRAAVQDDRWAGTQIAWCMSSRGVSLQTLNIGTSSSPWREVKRTTAPHPPHGSRLLPRLPSATLRCGGDLPPLATPDGLGHRTAILADLCVWWGAGAGSWGTRNFAIRWPGDGLCSLCARTRHVECLLKAPRLPASLLGAA